MAELSCADYTFPLLDRQKALKLIRLLDFDLVDLGLFARNPNFLPAALEASPLQFTREVKQSLNAAQLRPADVFLQVGEAPTQFSANDPNERIRQAARDMFSRALDLCSELQCAHITGLPGVNHGDRVQDFALAAKEAAWRVDAASKAGLVYSIEPHLRSICSDTTTTHALLAHVPGLTLTLDYGHFIFQGETNDAVHTLLPYASHVHLRGAAPGRLQTPTDESTIALQHIVQTLGAAYGGALALEYVWSDWHDCNRTDNLSETIRLRRQVTAIQANLNLNPTTGERHYV